MAAPASSSIVIGTHAAHRVISATIRPLVGVFEALSAQHRELLDLLRRAGASRASATRQALWVEARRQLLTHERTEEHIVYAALEQQDAAQILLQEHGDQSVELELAIAKLDATDDASIEWLEQLRNLSAMLEEHVREEDSEVFPRAQELLGENAARELEEPLMNARREVRATLA